ncbi:hypothetical protein BS17DRAFT_867367 [Gyrodon lividus]|nr:hypothetical protein BS17DRAFT_867367 [Gyrodon lividus]
MSDLPPAYDSIKELGVFDQLPADVKNQLNSLPSIHAQAQAKAQEAITDEVAKSDTTDKLMEEVKALGDSVLKVDEAFERVRVNLGVVDNNDYKDKDGNPIPKFQPTWVDYQKRWTTLLWDSRNTATATEAYINDFVQVIVPDIEDIQNDDDLADAKKDLQAFANRTDPFGKTLNSKETADLAQKYSQAFTDLRRDLEEFKGKFDSFAEDHKVELEANIKNKEAKLVELDLEIKKCQTVVMAMGIALGVTIFVTGAAAVGSLAALGPLGPFVAIGIVIVGAIAAISELGVLIAYVVKTNGGIHTVLSEVATLIPPASEYKSERDQVQNDLNDLKKQLQVLENLKATLEDQKDDITDICGRLDRFAAIWGYVRHDAQLIYEGIEAAVGDEGSKKAFKRRVALIKDSYTKLGSALALYATTTASTAKSS